MRCQTLHRGVYKRARSNKQSLKYRIIDSLKLEKASEIIKSNFCQPGTGTKCPIQSFFEHFQEWYHFPRQPIPMFNHSFGEDNVPDVQTELFLAQLLAISSYLVTSCLVEEIDSYLAATSFHLYKAIKCPLGLLFSRL